MNRPKVLDPREIRNLMLQLEIDDLQFAALLRIPVPELHDYLHGRSVPTGPVNILLQILIRDPEGTAIKLGKQLIADFLEDHEGTKH